MPSLVSIDWTPVIVAAATALAAVVGVSALLSVWIEKRRRRAVGRTTDQERRAPAAKAA